MSIDLSDIIGNTSLISINYQSREVPANGDHNFSLSLI